MLGAARSQLNYHEGRNNASKFGAWYGMDNEPWCDMFMAWCAQQAGDLANVGKFAYTPSHLAWFRSKGKFSTTPQRGALVFFKWPGEKAACSHIGLVETVRSDGTIVTIEGNIGDRVQRLVRRSYIVGYGHPNYSDNDIAPGGGVHIPSYPGTLIHRGSKGGSVRLVQKRLIVLKYSVGPYKDDGVFGTFTESAVRQFQHAKRLKVDGVVGPITWGALFK